MINHSIAVLTVPGDCITRKSQVGLNFFPDFQ